MVYYRVGPCILALAPGMVHSIRRSINVWVAGKNVIFVNACHSGRFIKMSFTIKRNTNLLIYIYLTFTFHSTGI